MMVRKTKPLPREAIDFMNCLLAKHLLLARLCQIPEFLTLWNKVSAALAPIMGPVLSALSEQLVSMSPEGREALLCSGGKGWHLYGEDAVREAQEASAAWLQRTCAEVKKHPPTVDYRKTLEIIVEPLGVPQLTEVMLVWDVKAWCLDRSSSGFGPIEGALKDILEVSFLKGLTDLSPAEAAMETPGRLRSRVRQKIAPLRRHLTRYNLRQRVNLWVRNKVCGESIADLAGKVSLGTDRKPVQVLSERWTRQQIREATRILGAEVAHGRPPKGGVLRRWKMML